MTTTNSDRLTAQHASMPAGTRVAITQVGDDSDVIYRGTVTGWRCYGDGDLPEPGGWVEVQIDGEHVRHEWPYERVWHLDDAAHLALGAAIGERW